MKFFRQFLLISAATLFLLNLFSTQVAAHNPPDGTTTVHVSLFEWGITLDTTSIEAGPVLFEITNDGDAPHAFKIGGVSIGTAETDVFQPGSARELSVDLPAGTFEIWCPISGHRELGMETSLQVTESTSRPPSSGPLSSVSSFDENGNCFIDDGEFFDAIDMWISRDIDDALFFQVVDAWIGEENVCASVGSSSAPNISVQVSAQKQLLFEAQSIDVSEIAVQIFDLDGTLIFEARKAGQNLTWNMRTQSGAPVANGVYIYRVATDVEQSEVRNFVVMR